MNIPWIAINMMYGLIGIGLCWLILANAVWFWGVRRKIALRKIFFTLLWLLFVAYYYSVDYRFQARLGTSSITTTKLFMLVVWIIAVYFNIYTYWNDNTKLPDFTTSRNFLLLRVPNVPIQPSVPDPSKGLFVPSIMPRGEEFVDVQEWRRSLPHRLKLAAKRTPAMLAIALLVVFGFFAITKVLFGFGPFF